MSGLTSLPASPTNDRGDDFSAGGGGGGGDSSSGGRYAGDPGPGANNIVSLQEMVRMAPSVRASGAAMQGLSEELQEEFRSAGGIPAITGRLLVALDHVFDQLVCNMPQDPVARLQHARDMFALPDNFALSDLTTRHRDYITMFEHLRARLSSPMYGSILRNLGAAASGADVAHAQAAARFSRCIYTIKSLHSLLETNYHLSQLAAQPGDYHVPSFDASLFPAQVGQAAALTNQSKLCFWALNKFSNDRAARYGESLCLPLYTNNNENTTVYEVKMTINDAIYYYAESPHPDGDENDMHSIISGASQGLLKSVVHYLTHVQTPMFPDVAKIRDRHLFAFSNGLWDCKEQSFTPYGEYAMRRSQVISEEDMNVIYDSMRGQSVGGTVQVAQDRFPAHVATTSELASPNGGTVLNDTRLDDLYNEANLLSSHEASFLPQGRQRRRLRWRARQQRRRQQQHLDDEEDEEEDDDAFGFVRQGRLAAAAAAAAAGNVRDARAAAAGNGGGGSLTAGSESDESDVSVRRRRQPSGLGGRAARLPTRPPPGMDPDEFRQRQAGRFTDPRMLSADADEREAADADAALAGDVRNMVNMTGERDAVIADRASRLMDLGDDDDGQGLSEASRSIYAAYERQERNMCAGLKSVYRMRSAVRYLPVVFPQELMTQANMNNPRRLAVPLLDKIFKDQGIEDEDTLLWIYALIGRAMYDLKELDDWQVALFFKGLAGTGKSTILNVIREIYGDLDTGIISNNIENQFGLSPVAGCLVAIIFELGSNFRMDQAEFQTLIEGGRMSMAKKNHDPVVRDWLAPLFAAGNMTGGWRSSQGAIGRRLIIVEFARRLKTTDLGFMTKIKEVMGYVMLACNSAYRLCVERLNNLKCGLWDKNQDGTPKGLPQYFHDQRSMLEKSMDSLYCFITASGQMDQVDDAQVPWDTFCKLYSEYCRTTRAAQVSLQQKDNYGHVFERLKLKLVEVEDDHGTGGNKWVVRGLQSRVSLT